MNTIWFWGMAETVHAHRLNQRYMFVNNYSYIVQEIDMRRILVKEGTTVGLANGILKADDKKIYSAENLKVGLFK